MCKQLGWLSLEKRQLCGEGFTSSFLLLQGSFSQGAARARSVAHGRNTGIVMTE